jgi:hypothetical protein
MPALVILLEAAVAALQNSGFQAPAAALIVGGITLVIGLILMLIGASRVRPSKLVPQRTIDQIQQDASVAKQNVRADNGYQRAA